jgi:hypothetical protein
VATDFNDGRETGFRGLFQVREEFVSRTLAQKIFSLLENRINDVIELTSDAILK